MTRFSKTATTHQPFDYQTKLAGGDKGAACESKLINIPIGCGKTAAVVLAWLWNRVFVSSLNDQLSTINHDLFRNGLRDLTLS